MLHAHVDAASAVTVVGPNVEVGSEAGAFNALFGAAPLGELDDAEPICLSRVAAQDGPRGRLALKVVVLLR